MTKLTTLGLTVHSKALALGFSLCGFTKAELPKPYGDNLLAFCAEGRHGTMNWLEERAHIRSNPRHLWPLAQSAIVLGTNYGPAHNPLDDLQRKDCGIISVYARAEDYHDLIKGRMQPLASILIENGASKALTLVDTAALMEKPLAAQSGLGWQGKHTNFISRDYGNWLFLAVILTDIPLSQFRETAEEQRNYVPPPNQASHCGTCRACLDICPTAALTKAEEIDARRCISYLTIEHKGPIPTEFRRAIGNRIYGCDDCLAICPWNKYAVAHQEMAFTAPEVHPLLLADWLNLSEEEFRQKFRKSPLKRLGYQRFLRNVIIAAGNSQQFNLVTPLHRWLVKTEEETLLISLIWALHELLDYDKWQEMINPLKPKWQSLESVKVEIESLEKISKT